MLPMNCELHDHTKYMNLPYNIKETMFKTLPSMLYNLMSTMPIIGGRNA